MDVEWIILIMTFNRFSCLGGGSYEIILKSGIRTKAKTNKSTNQLVNTSPLIYIFEYILFFDLPPKNVHMNQHDKWYFFIHCSVWVCFFFSSAVHKFKQNIYKPEQIKKKTISIVNTFHIMDKVIYYHRATNNKNTRILSCECLCNNKNQTEKSVLW